jgi:DNA-binding NarL/FixJ family response regulator
VAIKLLIADDHAVVRDALVDLFVETGDIDVVAQCTDGSEVVAAVARSRPDVVLMDIQMPRMNGLQAARELLGADPRARVVMLTANLSSAYVAAARELGVSGYLLKGDAPGDLPDQVRAVAAGGEAWSPEAAALANCN